MSDREALLSVSGITKFYGAHRALHNAHFELHAGEVLCLVGENGAGKSTLIKVLSGAVRPDSGTIGVGSLTYTGFQPRESMKIGISTIYQEVELVESLSVADNIFLGNERMAKFGLVVDARLQRQRAREILQMLRIDIDPSLLVQDLSAAQKQNLQIVKALHQDARVLIMDEPTSSLGLEEKRSLMELIRDLKRRGIGVIYVSHYLEEVFEIGDTIVILKDGEQVGTYGKDDISVEQVIRLMVGRDASMFFSRERVPIGDTQIEIRDMNWGSAVNHVSFSVRRGEILGMGGLVGSGRSELAACIFGMVRRDSGEVLVNGRKVHIRMPIDAIRNGICLITEDRKKYAMFDPLSIRENISITRNEQRRLPILSLNEESQVSREMATKLHIVADSLEQPIASLSGGNQQKTIIARWLLTDATLFIFDEPTKGVDIGAKQEIYELIVELLREGKSVVMISSDMPELLSMSDRIGVMRHGSLAEILDNREVNEEDLVRKFIGV